jgi:predicted ArsR family transcriptional regulator
MTDQEMERFKAQMNQRAVLFRRLVDRLGGEVLDIVEEYTIEQVRNKLQAADLQERNLEKVMELLWDQMGEGTEFRVEEWTPEVLRLRVTRCMIADEMRQLRAADVGGAFYCAYDHGFCQGLNPEIRFTRTKTLMQGEDCCNHTYELGRS